jgi:hypothetical protein
VGLVAHQPSGVIPARPEALGQRREKGLWALGSSRQDTACRARCADHQQRRGSSVARAVNHARALRGDLESRRRPCRHSAYWCLLTTSLGAVGMKRSSIRVRCQGLPGRGTTVHLTSTFYQQRPGSPSALLPELAGPNGTCVSVGRRPLRRGPTMLVALAWPRGPGDCGVVQGRQV